MIQNLIFGNIISFFFWNFISGVQLFYTCPICPYVPVGIIRVSFKFVFSSRISQSQQKLAKQITHFTMQFHSKNLAHFTSINSLDIENYILLQDSQKTFWIQKFVSKSQEKFALHHFWKPKNCILEAIWISNCLYISVYLRKEIFVPDTYKILSGGVWVGQRLNNSSM